MRLTPLGRREQLGGGVLMGFGMAAGIALGQYTPWAYGLTAFSAGTFLFILNFFRDPEREVPAGPNLLVSPADGRVTHLDEVDEPTFIGGRALRMSMFLSILDVHINRVPIAGTIVHKRHKDGEYVTAMREDSSHINEMQDLGLETGDPRVPRILIRQIAGVAARRIVCPLPEGTRLERGQRYGMIKFGSRTEVFVPADCPLTWRVAIGQHILGGETILGELG